MDSDFFSLSAMSNAIETRDAKAMPGFYADNARLRIIDRDHPPSKPMEIVGREAIARYFDDVCGRTMTHKVESGCASGDRVAFTQACTYPNGAKVFCSTMAELRDSLIADQTIVQAWDA